MPAPVTQASNSGSDSHAARAKVLFSSAYPMPEAVIAAASATPVHCSQRGSSPVCRASAVPATAMTASRNIFTPSSRLTASLALAVVAIALGRAGLRAGADTAARLTMGSGAAAAAVGLIQCALGLYLTLSVVPADHATTAAAVTEAVNRLDGVKMFLLAVMAVAGTVLARRTGLLPRWLRQAGVALAAAITASGIGYALLNNTFALAAWASLPLLLAWVTGAGIVLGRAGR